MPVQVMPPMYRMLADEVKWAIDDVSRRSISIHSALDLLFRRTSLTISRTSFLSLAPTDYQLKKKLQCNPPLIPPSGKKYLQMKG